MGGANTKNKEPALSSAEHYFDQFVQYEQCCGVQRVKVLQKGLIWQDNFYKNCSEMSVFYEWVDELKDLVKVNGRRLASKKFVDEFNQLKKVKKTDALKQKQILLSPSEIDEFKINLKNSVLLSYGQALKPSRGKQHSKIQSAMMNTPRKSYRGNTNFYSPISVSGKKKVQVYEDYKKDGNNREKSMRQSFSKFRESILSFVDDTMASLIRGHQKQISKQSAQGLEVFLSFSLILQKHLNDKQNIISQIIDKFRKYIYKKYRIFNSQVKIKLEESEMSQSQREVRRLQDIEHNMKKQIKKEKEKDRFRQLQNRKSLTEQQMQDLTTDIKMFLVLLRETVQDYYKIPQFQYQFNVNQVNQIVNNGDTGNIGKTNSLITNQDNILILLTSVLFKDEKFYNHIYYIFKKFHEDSEKKLTKILQMIQEKSPEKFEVKREYCLNESTLQKYKINQDLKVEETLSNEEKESTREFEENSEIKKKDKPYSKCLETLTKLPKTRTPTAKMKVIMECSQKITESISQFYSGHNIEFKNQVLDADQILSIFCYLISHTSIENLHSHLFFIQNFATQNQMISVTGYYYSVLTIAIEQLQNTHNSTFAQSDMKSDTVSQKQGSIKSKSKDIQAQSLKNMKLKGNFKKD